MASSKLAYCYLFTKGPTCGIWLPPANYISPQGNTDLHSDTMWYDRESIAFHSREISVLWVCFLLVVPPVRDILCLKCTSNLHRVGVVIIQNGIYWVQVIRRFRQWIQWETCGCQWVYCVIGAFVCRFIHVFRHSVLCIIDRPIIWIKRYQQNVNWSRKDTQSSPTLRVTSPVLLRTSRWSQTPLELSKVLSDCVPSFTGALERTCSYTGGLRMLRDMTYKIIKL